jgi:adenine phosphoribosyltransferase
MESKAFNLDTAIRKVLDFPKPGIQFYDLSSILTNPTAFLYCVEQMSSLYSGRGFNAVAAVEARGFLFAAPYAIAAGLPLVLVRKKGKLPGTTIGRKFALEYGEDEIQVHVEDVQPGWKVLIVDDLIATGGTIKATAELLSEAGAAQVEVFSVVGLPFLGYESVLADYQVTTLIDYQSE